MKPLGKKSRTNNKSKLAVCIVAKLGSTLPNISISMYYNNILQHKFLRMMSKKTAQLLPKKTFLKLASINKRNIENTYLDG